MTNRDSARFQRGKEKGRSPCLSVLMSGLVLAFVLSAFGLARALEGVKDEFTLTQDPLTSGAALENKGARNNEKDISIPQAWGGGATVERDPDRLIGPYTIGALTLSQVSGDIEAFLISAGPAFTFLSLTQTGTGNEVPAELESELGEAADGADENAISQSGEGNEVANLQQASGVSNNAFLVTQEGEGNILDVAQTATVSSNSLELSQSGRGNSGATSQTASNDNSAVITQTGDFNLFQVTQLTDNGPNSLIVVQSGGSILTLTQSGSGDNSVTVTQHQ